MHELKTHHMWKRTTETLTTRLGRWCGPWYSDKCDVMLKGWLTDHDNSVWHGPPVKKENKEEEESRRDPVNVYSTWHN